MRTSSGNLAGVLAEGSFSYYVVVDILHGTDRVAQDVTPESWSLSFNLGANLTATGRFRFVHQSERGESWVPDGVSGVLSPFKATLLVTIVVEAGSLRERVQYGMFDVVAVPFAEDTLARVGGRDVVVTSTVEVEVQSLDNRVAAASLRSPVTVSGSAVAAWRKYGLLPVATVAAGEFETTTFPAEKDSRLKLVQSAARLMGGTSAVNSRGEWALVDGTGAEVVLRADGESSTVVDVSSELSTAGFYNVVVGSYETEDGTPIDSVWEAPGDLSPDALGREWVRYHRSDMVRTQESADAATASVGALSVQQEVDVPVSCIFNPLLELGDRVRVEGLQAPISGVVQEIDPRDELMTVTVRVVRSL